MYKQQVNDLVTQMYIVSIGIKEKYKCSKKILFLRDVSREQDFCLLLIGFYALPVQQ